MSLRIFYADLSFLFNTSSSKNDTLHYRPVVEIVKYTYLVKFNSGSNGRVSVGSGAKPPEAERFFSFSEGVCCMKTGGGGHHQWKILGGDDRGRPKRGAAASPRPLDPPLVKV